MIQSTNSHVRRLLTEKSHYEDELKKAKDLLKGRMQGILLQCKYFFLINRAKSKPDLNIKFVMKKCCKYVFIGYSETGRSHGRIVLRLSVS